jgi:hypothetical protein
MRAYDPTNDCIGASTSLTDVCSTSVNRCTPSAGIGPECAVSPDGVVYVAVLGDNNVLTASGWRFDEPIFSFPDPQAVPSDELVTSAEAIVCAHAMCAPPCPGADAFWSPGCSNDAGTGARDAPSE